MQISSQLTLQGSSLTHMQSQQFGFLGVFFVVVVFRYGCHCMQNGEWVCSAAKTDECLHDNTELEVKRAKISFGPIQEFFLYFMNPSQ